MPALSIVMHWDRPRELAWALAACTAIDVWELRAFRAIPPLYQSGVRYAREVCRAPTLPGACERFLTARQCLREGEGDCDDLACWRAAELIVMGERARAIAMPSSVGFHVVVRRADGSIEDPSKRLGMRGDV
jgi:hypothetical protein